MTSGYLRISIPPARVRDVQKLLVIEAEGFLPAQAVHYDPDAGAFCLDLEGDAVSHILELLVIAVDARHAETWHERQARASEQLHLNLHEDPPEFTTELGGLLG